MAHVDIPFGAEQVSIEIGDNNLAGVYSPNVVEIPPDQEGLIARALDGPLGCPPLAEHMRNIAPRGDERAVIICDDMTRETPAHLALPGIIDRLNLAGISDDRIEIVFALGTHRPMTPQEMEAKAGRLALSRVRAYNSECRDESRMVNMGSTDGGVPVWVDARVAAADIRIGLGMIVPHPVVGWSSGAKIIFPGVTGVETVAAFHLNYGKFDKNLFGADTTPVREDIEVWMEVVGLHFMVELIVTPDARVYAATAGHFIAAQRAGIKYAREIYGVALPCPVDAAIVSSFPADLDLWQATKAICGADHAVRPGGSIVMLTPCPEGLGPHGELAEYIGCEDPDALLADAFAGKTAEPIAVSGGVTIARIGKKKRLGIVSPGITEAEAGAMRWQKYSTAQAAVDAMISEYGPGARIAIITHGGITCPYISGE